MKKRAFAWLCAVFCSLLFSLPASAQTLTTLRITQAVQQGDSLALYFDALDENGETICGLSQKDVTLILGDITLAPSLIPFAESDEGVGIVFAIDISQSLTEKQFEGAKTLIYSYIGSMNAQDAVAIVSFGSKVNTQQDFTSDKNLLLQSLNTLIAFGQSSRLNEGLIRSLDIARRLDDGLPARRAVVVLTDGVDNINGGITSQEVREKVDSVNLPVYVVGFQAENEAAVSGLDQLGVIVRASGGDLYIAPQNDLTDEQFAALRSRLNGGYKLSAALPEGMDDGLLRGISLRLNLGGRKLDDSIEFRFFSAAAQATQVDALETEEVSTDAMHAVLDASEGISRFIKNPLVWGIAFAALSLIAIFLFLKLRPKKKRRKKSSLSQSSNYTDSTNYSTSMLSIFGEAKAPSERTVSLDKASGLKVILIDQGRGKSRYELFIRDSATIGRASGRNTLVLSDKTVSACHCELTYTHAGLHVRDLKSQNGTFLNGVRVKHTASLRNGDLLQLGMTKLNLSFEDTI